MKKSLAFSFYIVLLIVGCNRATEVTSLREQIQAPDQMTTQVPTNTLVPPTFTPELLETDITNKVEEYTLEFESQGVQLKRTYLVFIPDAYTAAEKFPLVIYLHSYGWDAQKGMDYTQLNQVGNTHNFIIAYPNANSNWNSGISDNFLWYTPNNDDVEYINILLNALSDQYSIDQERIYATGYSNGGFMAYKLACQLSDRFAAVASVSGLLSTSVEANCNPIRAIPILHIHGTSDSYVPIVGDKGWLSVDETLSFWSNFNGCEKSDSTFLQDSDFADNCTVEKIIYQNCTNNSTVIYYKVINGGHTWPGAGPPGYTAGNTTQDFSANEVIWNFFEMYSLTTEN